MDEVELPPLPTSQASPRKYSLSPLRRKRSRSEYELEPATSSDPALFSSDEPAPSAELYSAKRRKDKWRGTWWGERLRAEAAREKRLFKRSYDSGIWMGSEDTESSLEDEFLDEQRRNATQDSFLRESGKSPHAADTPPERSATAPSRRVTGQRVDRSPQFDPQAATDNAYLVRARTVVQTCVEAGKEDVDLS
jgi:hypothetical protein